MVDMALAEAMIFCSVTFARDIDEIAFAGLTPRGLPPDPRPRDAAWLPETTAGRRGFTPDEPDQAAP